MPLTEGVNPPVLDPFSNDNKDWSILDHWRVGEAFIDKFSKGGYQKGYIRSLDPDRIVVRFFDESWDTVYSDPFFLHRVIKVEDGVVYEDTPKPVEQYEAPIKLVFVEDTRTVRMPENKTIKDLREDEFDSITDNILDEINKKLNM